MTITAHAPSLTDEQRAAVEWTDRYARCPSFPSGVVGYPQPAGMRGQLPDVGCRPPAHRSSASLIAEQLGERPEGDGEVAHGTRHMRAV